MGITDLDGNVLAEYAYDEWGKLLEITADSDENKALAVLNPLRYRGYYYDSETGMYYLQSRYYSPDLCRFISADDFNYITSSGKFAINAYAYCANNPVNFSDPTGYAISASGLFAALMIMSGLIIVYILIYSVVVCLNPSIVAAPSISFSIPSAAEKADVKIKDTIKHSHGTKYWIANIGKSYVTIASPMNFASALIWVNAGGDVFAINQDAAYSLAYAASGFGQFPIGPEKHGESGYYFHYHPNPKNGSHIFFL